MKNKILAILIMFFLCQSTLVLADTANLHINISGAATDNSYFLCIPNVGCLSILAGNRGKIYPLDQPLEINHLFITDVDHHFRVTPQAIPTSCQQTVQLNQSITISGHIQAGPNGSVVLNHLHCQLS